MCGSAGLIDIYRPYLELMIRILSGGRTGEVGFPAGYIHKEHAQGTCTRSTAPAARVEEMSTSRCERQSLTLDLTQVSCLTDRAIAGTTLASI